MDVDVDVGQDKLSFKGFGLTANLLGHVHIGNNMDTRGELSLADGRYRKYGQNLIIRRARLLFAGPIDQPYRISKRSVGSTTSSLAFASVAMPSSRPPRCFPSLP